MFYPFIIGISYERQTGDRRDDVADFARCVEQDDHWPVFCDDHDKLQEYLDKQGAGPLTLAAYEQAYKEYLKKVGHRLG